MSSADLDPFSNAAAWDKVEIAGQVSPGICTLSGFDRNFGWDVKKGKGTRGATLTLNEFPPIEGSIAFQLWTRTHFVEWKEFRKLFLYDPPKKGSDAVAIYHPALDDIDLISVVCKKISPILHAGKGLYTCKVDLIEYRPVPKKDISNTTDGSKFKAEAHKKIGKDDEPSAEQLLKMVQAQRDAAKTP